MAKDVKETGSPSDSGGLTRPTQGLSDGAIDAMRNPNPEPILKQETMDRIDEIASGPVQDREQAMGNLREEIGDAEFKRLQGIGGPIRDCKGIHLHDKEIGWERTVLYRENEE